MKNIRHPSSGSFRLCLLFIFMISACILLSGCAAKVKSDPFKAYADANRKLQQASDESLKLAYDWSLSSFSRRVKESNDAIMGLLLVQDPSDPYGWKTPPNTVVLPFKVSALHGGVDRLNDSLVQYANLLLQLASEELISSKEFDKMASDLNGNMKSLYSTFGKTPDDSKVALFSSAAMVAAQQYIESKRRNYLAEALRNNQKEIQSAASLGKDMTRLVADVLRQEYNAESMDLAKKLSVEPLLKYDEKYIAQLQVLRSIRDTYEQLPIAHQQLAVSLESENSPLGQIQTLYDNAMQIERLYEDLKKSK
jgi:hypothetical protein